MFGRTKEQQERHDKAVQLALKQISEDAERSHRIAQDLKQHPNVATKMVEFFFTRKGQENDKG